MEIGVSAMTERKNSFSNRSGDTYTNFSLPVRIAEKRALDSSREHWLLMKAAGISWSVRASTWSFIREISGEMISVRPGSIRPGI